ncbi:hypothetical protein IIQ43_12590 [Acinetobacter oleivorans]|uniref:Uncharacterized protein n=1 Tax=Acinetobacter oleivorans TaxID=1148157 RepID=A0ABR9NKB0_9GAMM|nr:hypothetical protein [Acinetobacter oleivorans]MBE2165361.1 hypothetical protein [Acinetobacter oleivorans]
MEIKVLNIPLHIQVERAKDAEMPLSEWQQKTLAKVNAMHKQALASVEAAKSKNLSQSAIERFQRKMDSAIR